MKSSSMFTVAAVFAAMTAAGSSFAAPPAAAVYTMTDAVVAQDLRVTGCAAMKTGGLATATFYADNTYEIVRTDVGPGKLPKQTGTYAVQSAKSTYNVYMSPDDASLTDLLGNYTGIDTSAFVQDVVGALTTLAEANCQLKYPTATVSVLAPTVITSKNTMVVNNSSKSATLSYKLKGKQVNTFKGTSKVGNFSASITVKGNVVETPVVL